MFSTSMRSLEHKPKATMLLADLRAWEKNPRTVRDEDIERLKKQIGLAGGLYKPLIVELVGPSTNTVGGRATARTHQTGIVLGGNMRLRALREMGFSEAWVSIVAPKDDEQRLKYALSDNGRAGTYDTTALAELAQVADFGRDMAALFKAEVAAPVTVDELLRREREQIGGGAEPDVDSVKAAKDIYDAGQTKQVVLFLTTEEKVKVLKQFQFLKDGMQKTTAGEVLIELARLYERDHGPAPGR